VRRRRARGEVATPDEQLCCSLKGARIDGAARTPQILARKHRTHGRHPQPVAIGARDRFPGDEVVCGASHGDHGDVRRQQRVEGEPQSIGNDVGAGRK
jgi:hypothetical protein